MQYKIKQFRLRGLATLSCKSSFTMLRRWLDWAFSKCLNKSTPWPVVKITSLTIPSTPCRYHSHWAKREKTHHHADCSHFKPTSKNIARALIILYFPSAFALTLSPWQRFYTFNSLCTAPTTHVLMGLLPHFTEKMKQLEENFLDALPTAPHTLMVGFPAW